MSALRVGTAFRALLPDANFPDRSAVDLARPEGLKATLSDLSPTPIINCAAYTAVDRAEEEEDLASMINAAAVEVMASYAGEHRIPFVTFSTDYVFDGTAAERYVESSTPNPINAYGRSKLAGERAALAVNLDALVVRTSWMFSATHRNLVFTILGLAAIRDVDVVADQTGCPTYAPDLASGAMHALGRGVSGLLHVTNTGATSWFEFARAACAVTGLEPDQIRPTTTDQFPTAARLPAPDTQSCGPNARPASDSTRFGPWSEALHHAVTHLVPSPQEHQSLDAERVRCGAIPRSCG